MDIETELVPMDTTRADPVVTSFIGDRDHHGHDLVCLANQTSQVPQAVVKEARVSLDIQRLYCHYI